MGKKSKTRVDLEWENRTLCSDGNCIGVIGKNGRCNECGKPYDGVLPWLNETSEGGENVNQQDVSGEHAEPGDSESPASGNTDHSKSDADLEWEKRTLCSDGNCIGVIGPDGLCKECGKPLET